MSANISFRAGSTVGTVLPTDSQALHTTHHTTLRCGATPETRNQKPNKKGTTHETESELEGADEAAPDCNQACAARRDGGAGATVKLTFADGTELTRSVAIGE